MATEKSAAILSAALAWAAAAAIVGTHACRSTTRTGRAPNALAKATLHGDAQGQVLADLDRDGARFIVELVDAHPGTYEVTLSSAAACPWDQAGRSGTTGSAGDANPPVIGQEARSDSVEIGRVEVGTDGRGALDTTLPKAALDARNPKILDNETIMVKRHRADDPSAGAIACGRFVEAPPHGQPGPYLPLAPVPPILPPG